ncbi:protein Churchill-like [Patella vulgata]|uniref:protein Churchill-like n=1 Tax=Patella vulgata TaxID=6465 RepID=UPI0024A87112|nr:protein Churchill-like [Patella vulgata]
MCEGCVREEYPDRGTLCLESGCYMMNYAGCHECQDRSTPKIVNKKSDEINDEEMITFQHVCSKCNHLIGEHEHIFKVSGEYQLYEMSCILCGTGEDQRSIMPCDPRGPQMNNDFID